MDLSEHLSKKDAIDLLELTYKASQCYNPDKFGQIVLELRNFIDFDHSFCAYGNLLEGAENAINVLGCGGFLDTLLADKIYENDPVAFEMSYTKVREDKFKWVGPLATKRDILVAKKGSGIKINSLEDAKKVKCIGTYRTQIN